MQHLDNLSDFHQPVSEHPPVHPTSEASLPYCETPSPQKFSDHFREEGVEMDSLLFLSVVICSDATVTQSLVQQRLAAPPSSSTSSPLLLLLQHHIQVDQESGDWKLHNQAN